MTDEMITIQVTMDSPESKAIAAEQFSDHYEFVQRDINPRCVVLNGDGSVSVTLPEDEAKALGLYERKAAGTELIHSLTEQQPDGTWATRVGTIPRAIKASAATSTPTDGLRGEDRRLLSIGSKAARFRF